jgi:maleate isomerase
MTRGRVVALVARTTAPNAPAATTVPPAGAELRASARPAAIDEAARTLSGAGIDAVVHASTTSGYVLGSPAELALVELLAQRCGVPAVASCAAAVAALQAHGVEHVQLVHPPWFDDEFDALGAAYFGDRGLRVDVSRARELPEDPARVRPELVIDWAERHLHDRAQALFLAGNGFRAASAIGELERRTGKLVLEANQVLLWAVLEATGRSGGFTGYGRLLESCPPGR